MSNDLIHVATPRALTAAAGNLDVIREAIANNITGGMTDLELPRIVIAGGAMPCFGTRTLAGDRTQDSFDAVAALTRCVRNLFSAKNAGNQPPDCSSTDCITGKGIPGGDCSRCPHAQWSSADEGAGQACKQVQQLFLLRGDQLLPEVLSLPPTSLKGARQFFVKLTAQGIPYYQAVLRFELEKAQNAAGIQYGRVVMKFIRRLEPEEAARSRQYHELCRTLAARVPMGLDPEICDQAADVNS
jgi:hypothetical protein